MGIYVNPGNSGFAEINDQDYVDKAMLIEQINRAVGKKNKLRLLFDLDDSSWLSGVRFRESDSQDSE